MNIKIHNLKWRLNFIPNEAMKVFFDGITSPELCGFVNRKELCIFIDINLKDDLLKRTIIHELTHAYFWSFGLVNFESLTEEDFCNFMETHASNILELADKIYNEFKKEK